jgi:hypothetical protein
MFEGHTQRPNHKQLHNEYNLLQGQVNGSVPDFLEQARIVQTFGTFGQLEGISVF